MEHARPSSPAAIAGLLVISVLAGCGKEPPASSGATHEAAAPAATVSATPESVSALIKEHELAGKIVLVEFGTIGCPLSGSGLNKMIELAKSDAAPEVSFVRLEASADEDTVTTYYGGKKPPFTVVRDQKGTLAKSLGLRAFPSFALLDKHERVRYRGSIPTDEELAKWSATLLAEATDAGEEAPLFGVSTQTPAQLLEATVLPDLNDEKRPLESYVSTGGLLVVFVNMDCPFSNQAVDEMADVTETLAGFGVPSVLVNLNEPADLVKKFYAERDTGAHIVYDTCEGTQQLWNIDSVPTLALLNEDNEIHYRGPAVWGNLATAAAKMLSLPANAISFGSTGTEYG